MSDDIKVEDEQMSEEVEKEDSKISGEVDVEKLQLECEKLKDKLLRNSAELENFKRRTNDEKQNFMKYATQDIMSELIQILDNYERALDTITGKVDDSVYAGIKMIFDQLSNLLSANGVELIDSIGSVFDPNIHQAVMTGSDENYESGVVIEEFQKGYKMKDKILRPAMVKVNE